MPDSPLAGCTVAVRRIDRMTVVGPTERWREVKDWLRSEEWSIRKDDVDNARFRLVAERDADPTEALPDA